MQQPSQWGLLFDAATATIRQTEESVGGRFLWSFGGGTALMLQIDHRESHDVDLFIDDPQVLPFLNPLTQRYTLDHAPDDYDTDGARVTKLIYHALGEVDFICCGDVTEHPAIATLIRGTMVQLETPAEIIAKKVFYRGASLQPRDMFDMTAVAEARGDAYVVDAVRQCGPDACRTALAVAERFDRNAAGSVIAQLMLRDTTRHLVATAQTRTIALLGRAVG